MKEMIKEINEICCMIGELEKGLCVIPERDLCEDTYEASLTKWQSVSRDLGEVIESLSATLLPILIKIRDGKKGLRLCNESISRLDGDIRKHAQLRELHNVRAELLNEFARIRQCESPDTIKAPPLGTSGGTACGVCAGACSGHASPARAPEVAQP